MAFFPSNYDSEALANSGGGGRYFKPQDGKNKIRICSDAIFGFMYWTEDNKPKRSADHPGNNPPDMRKGDGTKNEKVKPFLAMVVWDYAAQSVCIWEVTQATIMRALEDLYNDEDWGDPKNYDLTINRTGKALETSYSLIPSNMKSMSGDVIAALDAAPVNLAALYAGENPFDPNVAAAMPSAEDSPAWATYKDLLVKADGDPVKTQKAIEWAVGKMPMREDEIRATADIPF